MALHSHCRLASITIWASFSVWTQCRCSTSVKKIPMDLNIYTEKCQASVADIFSFTNISLPDEFNDISYILFFCFNMHYGAIFLRGVLLPMWIKSQSCCDRWSGFAVYGTYMKRAWQICTTCFIQFVLGSLHVISSWFTRQQLIMLSVPEPHQQAGAVCSSWIRNHQIQSRNENVSCCKYNYMK